MTMHSILPDASYFQGQVDLESKPDGIKPWRLPLADLPLYATHGPLIEKAGSPAGVRLRICTNSPVIEFAARYEPGEDTPTIDLVCDGDLLSSLPPDAETGTVRFEGLGEQSRIYELWLPVFVPTAVTELRVQEGAELEPAVDDRLRWVTYGSSITHCRAGFSPARSWPAVAARALDLNLTCLGYGGNCHLEPMLGRLIRDRPADIISLKLGINVYGSGSLNTRTFAAAAVGLVQLIREKHPTTPIGLITPIYSCGRETKTNAAGMTLENYREELRRAFEALGAHGDKTVFLFEGCDLLGDEETHLLPDNLHPNGEGYELMGTRAAEKILPVLLQARPNR